MKRAHGWASAIFFLGTASTSCGHFNGLTGFEKNPTVFSEADGDFPARSPLAPNDVVVSQSPPAQEWHRVGTIEVGSNCEDENWNGTIIALEAPRQTCSRGFTIVKASHPGIAYVVGCFAR